MKTKGSIEIKLNKKSELGKTKNTLFYILLIIIFALMFATMDSYISIDPMVSVNLQIIFSLCLIAFSYLCLMLWGLRKNEKRTFSIFGIAAVFYIYSIFCTVVNYGLSVDIVLLRNQSWWFACFTLFWIATAPEKDFDIRRITKYIIVAFVCFSVGYFTWIRNRISTYEGLINALYFGLALLPVVFMTKHIPFRIGAICLVVFNILLSGKRTAFFVFLAALIIPLLIELFGKRKRIAFVTVLIGFIGVAWLYNYIIAAYEVDLFERLSNIAIDGGSGRADIYKMVWDSFGKSDFLSKMFGRGFNGVYLYSSVGTSAHNDFLEVLYDFGIIGLGLYAGLIAKLISGAFKLYNVKSKFAPMYLSALVSFLIMSTTSHLILYPTYIVFLLLFFVIGIWDLNRILQGDKS